MLPPQPVKKSKFSSSPSRATNQETEGELIDPQYKNQGSEDRYKNEDRYKKLDQQNDPLWKSYFDFQIKLEIPSTIEGLNDVFNVYVAGSIHNHVLLCFHGGGHTSLSWSLVAGLLKHAFCVVSFDCRGHGLTCCQEPHKLDSNQLIDDSIHVAVKISEWISKERKDAEERGEYVRKEATEELSVRDKILMQSRSDGVSIILMGHSLGGAIASQLAASGNVPNIQGLIVLDVVEGAAMEALPGMKRFIEQFPSSFHTTNEAVDWSLKYVLKNRQSAEISIPSQLYFNEEQKLWKWRVDLVSTSDYWEGWFRGISQKFLTAKVGSGGKVLVLVGHDRLDKDLTIGHMQGKYQLQIIPKSGHVIEEDQPEDVADIVLQFAARYRLLPPDLIVPVIGGDESHPSTSLAMFPTGPMFPLPSGSFKVPNKKP